MKNSKKLNGGDSSQIERKTILEGFLVNKRGEGLMPSFVNLLDYLFMPKKNRVTLIIPAYNEEKSISKVIKQAQKVKEISQILVIDDGSKDQTAKIAKNLGVEVIQHHKNLGKGESIKTGISHAKEEIVMFLDADLKNITDKKIRSIFRPIIKNNADFTKAIFRRKRGRVTEFAVKPLMNVIYPETSFKQPISGQFAGRKEFLKNIKIEPRWGIDLGILLDAVKNGQRVVEVYIGELVHKMSSDDDVAKMSKEVLETMLKKAGYLCNDHKVIFFSDKTLFSPIFENKIERFLEILKNKKIRVILLTQAKIDPKFKKFFDDIRIIRAKDSPAKVLQKARRIMRKHGARPEECVLVGNDDNFEELANKACLSYCFKNSPEKLMEESELISSLAEIFMYLK